MFFLEFLEEAAMKKVVGVVKGIVREDDGASMVEYAVGVGFIAAILLVAVALFSGKLGAAFDAIGGTLDQAAAGNG